MKEYILDYEDLKITATECKSFRMYGHVYNVSVYYKNELMYAYPIFEDDECTAIREVLCLYRERDIIPYPCFLSKDIPTPCLEIVNSLIEKLDTLCRGYYVPDFEFNPKEVEI